MEMDSAIRHNIPIVVVVSNNAGFTSRQTGYMTAGDKQGRQNVGRELGHQRYDNAGRSAGRLRGVCREPRRHQGRD